VSTAVMPPAPTAVETSETILPLPANLVDTRATWTGTEWVDANGATYDVDGNLLASCWAVVGVVTP